MMLTGGLYEDMKRKLEAGMRKMYTLEIIHPSGGAGTHLKESGDLHVAISRREVRIARVSKEKRLLNRKKIF